MKKKNHLAFVYLWFITILAYVPILVAVVYSFNKSKSSTMWTGFTLDWFRQVFKDKSILTCIANSLILGLVASVLSAVLAVIGTLSFRKKRTFLGELTRQIQMIPLMIPEIVLAVAYLAFFRLLNLPFGMLTLVLGHMTFCVPYIFIQLETRVEAMNSHPIEAARLMGAGPVRAFFDITLPYLAPALISGLFLSFAMSMDDVIISMFVTGVNVNTVSMKIYSQVKTTITPKVNALCTLLLFATVLLLALAGVLGKYRRSEK